MSNLSSSGSKRPRESHEHSSESRSKRSRDEQSPRDWRQVHLQPPREPVKDRCKSRKIENHQIHRDHGSYKDKEKSIRDGEQFRKPFEQQEAHLSDREEGELTPVIILPPVRARTPTYHPEPELELELPRTPPNLEEARAARAARKLAIQAKYTSSASGTPEPSSTCAVDPPNPVVPISDPPSQSFSAIDLDQFSATETIIGGAEAQRESISPEPENGTFELIKGDEGDSRSEVQNNDAAIAAEQISAADYNPNLDRREDEEKRAQKDDDVQMVVEEEDYEEEEEDVDDMFAVASEKPKLKKVRKVIKTFAPAMITTNLDSAADPEGYYTIILGEQLDNGRYQVFSVLGKGMFANVVRARVLLDDNGLPSPNREVAIKIVRAQESMYRAGLKEAQILNRLKLADPDDKKHVVRLERTFEHRGHLCMVFESLSMNLRDVVKRFGKDVGLNIRAVRAYAHQLFLSLSLLKKANIMHADIKPDNILVNEQKTVLKLCDLGSASDASENEITPYLVSRFYRAPEIILGVPYDPALDIWSIGCTLFELYTGKILFPGRSNNHMLLLMMELKGRFNVKMIKRAKFGDSYFDEMGGFDSVERDRVSGTDVVRKVHISKPTRDLRTRLMPPASAKLNDDEIKMIISFIDLLDKCLVLDPARRITPKEGLAHAFIRG